MVKDRKIYYDLIRIIACYLVIANHTVWMLDSFGNLNIVKWTISNMIFFICKISVPLFIMLSGTLLLGKEEGYRDLLQKRILKMIGIIIIWSIIYATYYKKSMLSIGEIYDNLKYIIKEPMSIHFWYIYMLIGLYVMTPFIRKMIKNFTDKDFKVFLFIWIIYSTLIPFVRTFKSVEYSYYFSIPLFSGYIGYYIAGYYLDKINIDKNISIRSIVMFIIGLGLNIGVTLILSKKNGYTSRDLDNVLMFPIMVMSFTIFILIKKIGNKLNYILNKENVKNIILSISSKTFGIYLVHLIINDMLNKSVVGSYIFNSSISIILQFFIYDLLLFIICYLIIFIIQKLPILNKIV